VPHGDDELRSDLLESNLAAFRERHPQAQHGPVLAARDLVHALGMEHIGRGPFDEQLGGQAIEHLGADDLLLEVAGGQNRHWRESLRH
jgi:hypothetical protein